MPIIDAIFAFAVTMLLVSTVVSQIVRVVHNRAQHRADQLKAMLSTFVAREVQPVVKRELLRISAVTGVAVSSRDDEISDAAGRLLLQPESPDKKPVTELSTSDMLELVRRSELGEKLVEQLPHEVDAILAELARRFEAHGRIYSATFKKASAVSSTGWAFVLALVLNVDALFIASTYLTSEVSRQQAIGHLDAAVGQIEATPDDSTALKEELETTRRQIALLRGSGLPLGWHHFPHSGLVQWDERAQAEWQERNNILGWFSWGLGVVLVGFLAGLGAPFWYDVVTGIARVARARRGGAAAENTREGEGGT